MKQKDERKFDICIFQEETQKAFPENLSQLFETQAETGINIGFINEWFDGYGADFENLIADKKPIYENNQIDYRKQLLVKKVSINYETLKPIILDTFASQELIEKYLLDRSDELIDSFQLFKFQNSDQYLAVFPRGKLIVVTLKQTLIDLNNIETLKQQIQKFREFFKIDQDRELDYHIKKIGHNCKLSKEILDRLIIPCQGMGNQNQKTATLVENIEFQNAMKPFIGEALCQIPIFNKENVSFHWDQLQVIKEK